MDSSKSLDLVTCSIEMRFTPEVLENAVRLLLSTVGRTEARPGCLQCNVSRDAVEQGRIRYTEVWESLTAFQRHLRAEEFKVVLVGMELCSEEPRVMIGDLSGRSGIAYLEELREGSGNSVPERHWRQE